MNKTKKSLCILTAFLFSSLIIYKSYYFLLERWLITQRSDAALVHYNYIKAKDSTKRRIFFLGGSNVREAYNREQLANWGHENDFDIINLSHSSSNTIEEQIIMVNSIELKPEDRVFFSIYPTDLNVDSEPRIAISYESPIEYLNRINRQSLNFSYTDYIEKTLSYYLEPFKAVDIIFGIIRLRRYPDEQFNWSYRYKGKKHDEIYFSNNLEKYSTNKFDYGMDIYKNQGKLKELLLLKDKFNDSIIFYELPRNPLYNRIISQDYLHSHYEAIKALNIKKFNNFNILKSDFYDFNHVNIKGRKKMTEHIISLLNEMKIDGSL